MSDIGKKPDPRPDEEDPSILPTHSYDQQKDRGPADLPPDEDYDESQRAEILEAEGRGPTDGTIQTDIPPDIDGNLTDDDEIEDDEDQLDIVEDTDESFIDPEDWTDEDEPRR